MPARNRVPSFQIASGTANERDNSYNIPTGSIFFNTDTSNIELSGNVVVAGKISAPANTSNIELSGNVVINGNIFADKFGEIDTAQETATNSSPYNYNVMRGYPGPNTNGNDKGGSISHLEVTINNSLSVSRTAIITGMIVGEWSKSWDTGILLWRGYDGATNGVLLGGSPMSNRAGIIAPFTHQALGTDSDSTPEVCFFQYIDTVAANRSATYRPVLVSTGTGTHSNDSKWFYLNRTWGDHNNNDYNERAMSNIIARFI